MMPVDPLGINASPEEAVRKKAYDIYGRRSVFRFPEGDGTCSACQGTGFARFFDAIALELLNVEQSPCEERNGSCECQTCSGTGVIEEPEIKIAV